MYPPQPMPMQPYMPTRPPANSELVFGILYLICGIAILLSFFALPFLEMRRGNTLTASELNRQLTNSEVVSRMYTRYSSEKDVAFAMLLPNYVLNGFVFFGVVYLIATAISLYRYVTSRPMRIGSFCWIFQHHRGYPLVFHRPHFSGWGFLSVYHRQLHHAIYIRWQEND